MVSLTKGEAGNKRVSPDILPLSWLATVVIASRPCYNRSAGLYSIQVAL